MDEQKITDIAVQITSKLVEMGYVPNCIDTSLTHEWDVQDAIEEILNENL